MSNKVEHEQDSLATELLRELKLSAKRWFIAFCVMTALEVSTIAGFLIYLSLPTEEVTIEQEADENENSLVTQSVVEGENNGKADGQTQKESGEEFGRKEKEQ